MKKLVQICAMLSLVIVLSAVSAKAQTVRQYAAQIPFDFNIGQKSYQAGDYVIKISKFSLNTVSLALEDKNRNILQTMFVRQNGDVSKDVEKLIFTRNGNQRYLSAMFTKEMGLLVTESTEAIRNLKAKGQPERKTEDVVFASNK